MVIEEIEENEREVVLGKFKLICSHMGNIVWKSEDGKTIGVKGTSPNCLYCGKGRNDGWSPTVHLREV